MKTWLKVLLGGLGVVGLGGGGVVLGTRLSRPETEIAAPRKQALQAELVQLKRDQKARATQVGQILKSPQVRKDKQVLKAAQDVAAKQAEVALLVERTGRLMQANDPRARAYEQALGRSLAEVDRSAHVLNQVAYKRGIAPKPRPQWTAHPGGGRPEVAAALGVAAGVGATILALDLAYDLSRYNYAMFDNTWDVAYFGVPATAWQACDVYAEIDRLPRAEVAYVFQNYFIATEYNLYAEAMHIEAFRTEELAHWAGVEHYDAQYQSVELTPDWLETDELASFERDFGVESELAASSSWDYDWQLTERDAEQFDPAAHVDLAEMRSHEADVASARDDLPQAVETESAEDHGGAHPPPAAEHAGGAVQEDDRGGEAPAAEVDEAQ